jgi:phage baseplate assembly protein W
MAFLSPTTSRTRTVPTWYGPVLTVNTNFGLPVTLLNPNATSNPQTSGPIFPSSLTYRAAINSSLDMLFGTRPGERIYLSDYGSNLDAYVFEQLDAQLTAAAQAEISKAIQTYEPRISITGISVNKDQNNNQVFFTINYVLLGSPPNDILSYTTSPSPILI